MRRSLFLAVIISATLLPAVDAFAKNAGLGFAIPYPVPVKATGV